MTNRIGLLNYKVIMDGSITTKESLFLIQALLQALSHRLRTPLSVILNDLTYFKALLPGEDLERTISRCREISEALKEATSACSVTAEDQKSTTAAELIAKVTELGMQSVNCDIAGSLKLDADPGQLAKALGMLARLFDLLSIRFAASANNPLLVELADKVTYIELSLSKELPLSKTISGPINSLTSYFFEHLDIDSIYAPLTDAILISEGCKVAVSQLDSLKIAISLRKLNE